MKTNRSGSHFTYERGDTVASPLGIVVIVTDPDPVTGRCYVRPQGQPKAKPFTADTFQFTQIMRKWAGSRDARIRKAGA